jgi:hypothetical protein
MTLVPSSKQQSELLRSTDEVPTKQSEDSLLSEKDSDLGAGGETREIQDGESSTSNYEGDREKSTCNDVFADFLLGVCVSDTLRQHDAWNLLMRIALRLAQKSGFIRYSCSGDYEQVAIDCLMKEVQKHNNLKAHEIVEHHGSKNFDYIGKVLAADYIDEMRKIGRSCERPVDWDHLSFGGLPMTKKQDVSLESETRRFGEQSDDDALALQFQNASNDLPLGPAAISEAIADLFCHPEQLLWYTDPELSDTKCESRFVEYVAQKRGIGEQVVRKDLKQFKDNCKLPEYARILEILKRNLNLQLSLDPKITAPATPKPQPCVLPVAIQAQSEWSDKEKCSNFCPARCPICSARLHNEGDYCSVCFPEDVAQRLQVYPTFH